MNKFWKGAAVVAAIVIVVGLFIWLAFFSGLTDEGSFMDEANVFKTQVEKPATQAALRLVPRESREALMSGGKQGLALQEAALVWLRDRAAEAAGNEDNLPEELKKRIELHDRLRRVTFLVVVDRRPLAERRTEFAAEKRAIRRLLKELKITEDPPRQDVQPQP